jgi:hypothetical protein
MPVGSVCDRLFAKRVTDPPYPERETLHSVGSVCDRLFAKRVTDPPYPERDDLS